VPGDEAGAPEIEIVLRRGAALSGTVSTPSGEPAAGAEVTVLDNGGAGPLAGLELPRATADEQGEYRLEGIAPGDRAVRAALRGFLPDTRRIAMDAADREQQLDLQLRRGTRVSGRAVTAAGTPVRGARLFLAPLGDQAPPSPAETAADGAFGWQGVAAGRYRLQAEMPGLAARPLTVEVDGAPVTGLEVTFTAAGTLEGRITGLAPGEAERLEIRASAPERRDRTGRVQADGSYRVDGLAPGPWVVAATLPGTARAARGSASVTEGPAGTFLDLEMGGGLRLEGRVERGGAPLAQVLVTVAGAGGSAVTATGADGGFRFEGLTPGGYTLIAAHPASGAKSVQQVELARSRTLTVELPPP
jgi:hypothetical protein